MTSWLRRQVLPLLRKNAVKIRIKFNVLREAKKVAVCTHAHQPLTILKASDVICMQKIDYQDREKHCEES